MNFVCCTKPSFSAVEDESITKTSNVQRFAARPLSQWAWMDSDTLVTFVTVTTSTYQQMLSLYGKQHVQ